MLAKNRRILVCALAARLGFDGQANRLRGQVEASGRSVQPITASAFGRLALIRSHLHDIRSCQSTGSRAGDETSSRLEKLAPLHRRRMSRRFQGNHSNCRAIWIAPLPAGQARGERLIDGQFGGELPVDWPARRHSCALPHARGVAGGALAWILPFADTGSPMPFSLDFISLRRSYAERAASPIAVARAIAARIRARGEDAVWISRVAEDALLAAAAALERRAATEGLAAMPLYGLPFAIKDNIDVAGLPTTAACPGFAYPPQRSAPAVERLLAAGALLIGKTNLDQFATGLVGTRSPYGVPPNPFDPAFIPGGSSSGSAVAVAAGLVAFALGTDTAGSGRVPAAFNNIVGLKPTRGMVSARGVVPACRSLDCVSVFALTVPDAAAVLEVISGADPEDGYSRPAPPGFACFGTMPSRFTFGVPRMEQREFFANPA